MSRVMTGELEARVERALAELTGSPVEVRAITPLHGGACQDNYRVDVGVSGGPLAGDRRFALRSDALRSLPGSLPRRVEVEVIHRAVRGGVRTPRAYGLFPGLVHEGRDAYFLDWVDGEAIGAKVVRDPLLERARAGLPAELAEVLARVHEITPGDSPELPLDRAGLADPAAAAIAAQRDTLDRIPEPRPALELALEWLERNKPPPGEVTLVHGDFRTGNFLVTPGGLAAVLDWEFARWGDPMEDVAWLCVRDWRFGQVDRPAGGLCSRAELHAEYSRARGKPVDPRRAHFWEVLGNVRWALGASWQGLRYLEAGETDLELIAISRRAAEMEFEALRLIDRGSAPDGSASTPTAPPPRDPRAAPGPSPAGTAGGVLLHAIARFLEADLRPHLRDPAINFRARIAAHLAALVARELEHGDRLAAAELARLRTLAGVEVGTPSPRPTAAELVELAERRTELARRIRAGALDEAASARARALVRATLADQLSVIQPRFDTRLDVE